MKPPAIRFIRAYDLHNHRMVNRWEYLTTQEQIDNSPKAIEMCVTAKTREECMIEIRKYSPLPEEALRQIELCPIAVLAQDPIYFAAYGGKSQWQDTVRKLHARPLNQRHRRRCRKSFIIWS